jgi:hypothetical protein
MKSRIPWEGWTIKNSYLYMPVLSEMTEQKLLKTNKNL